MCGIVGYYAQKRGLAETPCLDEAIRLLTHRGPDDHGSWQEGRVGLGMRRLAIQDLSSKGHQPMVSEDERYILVFNGEIYNFKELRSDLERAGHTFKSGTDTEVLLKLYELENKACLTKLNGLFTFAIYDKETDKLFLVRDRFGIKPLYILKDQKGLFFASEIKAFLPFVKTLGLTWEMNQNHLFEYMLFRYIAGNETMIRHVSQCKPGYWIEIEASGSSTEGSYYDLKATCEAADEYQDVVDYDESAHIEAVQAALQKSIDLRMISDAPLGVALSGGVDSSLITALLRASRTDSIDTFSVIFNEKEQDGRAIDESPYSDWIANKYETRHHRLLLDEQAFTAIYPKAIWHSDDPLNIPNALGVYLFSQAASSRVKVLLGGEGADEVFGGYSFFADPAPLDVMKHRVSQIDDIRKLIRFPQETLHHRDALLSSSSFRGVNSEIHYCLNSYLQTIENRLDKMSMANGLEMRVPFLDHNVVEASLTLPSNMKVRGDCTKYVLKKLSERYMPSGQIYRKKVGFSTPINKWLRDKEQLGKYIPILEEQRTLEREYIHSEGVKELLNTFRRGEDTLTYTQAGRIWMLLNLELWTRTFLEDKRVLSIG